MLEATFDAHRSFVIGVMSGLAGSLSGFLQVLCFMWARTVMNVQYAKGGKFLFTLKKLWNEDGVRRLYRGCLYALLQNPAVRFGDTAANSVVSAYFRGQGNSVFFQTMISTSISSLWRLSLTPIDFLKTNMQVQGKGGVAISLRRVRDEGYTIFWSGGFGNLLASWVGTYSWFVTYNAMQKYVPYYGHGVLYRNSREALIGCCSSISSDVCTNSVRVVKTITQVESNMSYGKAVNSIINTSGLLGLLGRGLRTRVVLNAAQSMFFAVLWKAIEQQGYKSFRLHGAAHNSYPDQELKALEANPIEYLPHFPLQDNFDTRECPFPQCKHTLNIYTGENVSQINLSTLLACEHIIWVDSNEVHFYPGNTDGIPIFSITSSKYSGEGTRADLKQNIVLSWCRERKKKGVLGYALYFDVNSPRCFVPRESVSGYIELEPENFLVTQFDERVLRKRSRNNKDKHYLRDNIYIDSAKFDASALRKRIRYMLNYYLTKEDKEILTSVTKYPFHELLAGLSHLDKETLRLVLSWVMFVDCPLNEKGLHIARALLAERMEDAREIAFGLNRYPHYKVWKRDGILFFPFKVPKRMQLAMNKTYEYTASNVISDKVSPQLESERVKDYLNPHNKFLIDLLQMTSAFETPVTKNDISKWRLHHLNDTAEVSDVQHLWHTDRIFTTVKIIASGSEPWTSSIGPINFIKGSQRASISKLKFWHEKSKGRHMTLTECPQGYMHLPLDDSGFFDLMGYSRDSYIDMHIPPNTLVVLDTKGFHRREMGAKGKKRSMWFIGRKDVQSFTAFKRQNPFRKIPLSNRKSGHSKFEHNILTDKER